jgi:hypothetical protein
VRPPFPPSEVSRPNFYSEAPNFSAVRQRLGASSRPRDYSYSYGTFIVARVGTRYATPANAVDRPHAGRTAMITGRTSREDHETHVEGRTSTTSRDEHGANVEGHASQSMLAATLNDCFNCGRKYWGATQHAPTWCGTRGPLHLGKKNSEFLSHVSLNGGKSVQFFKNVDKN